MDPLLWIKNAKYVGENFQPDEGEVHVLVVVPKQAISDKMIRSYDWFMDKSFIQTKKRRTDEDNDGYDSDLRYFRMSGFPPLAHPLEKYNTIVGRDAYIVIFEDLMRKMKSCFEENPGSSNVATSNPGTGKSRFYLYCIFRLLQMEFKEFSSFELVLNFGDRFHKYCAESEDFIELDRSDVIMLSYQHHTLQLIEGNSSRLMGWKGVSVLFTSPGSSGLHVYSKVESNTYIVPVCSLYELQDYNSLLSDKLKLSDDVLVSRYT